MTIIQLWDFIQTGGIAALLFIALLGVFRGWWVPGYILRETEEDRDEWKAIALENLKVSSTVVDELATQKRPTTSRRPQP